MGRKKKVEGEITIASTETEEVKTEEPVEPIKVSEEKKRDTFYYPIPETKEDYLALHKCLKDLGVNSTGDLEVRASRM